MSTLENCLFSTYLLCFSTRVHMKKNIEIRRVRARLTPLAKSEQETISLEQGNIINVYIYTIV